MKARRASLDTRVRPSFFRFGASSPEDRELLDFTQDVSESFNYKFALEQEYERRQQESQRRKNGRRSTLAPVRRSPDLRRPSALDSTLFGLSLPRGLNPIADERPVTPHLVAAKCTVAT